jgi:hypothetical protein
MSKHNFRCQCKMCFLGGSKHDARVSPCRAHRNMTGPGRSLMRVGPSSMRRNIIVYALSCSHQLGPNLARGGMKGDWCHLCRAEGCRAGPAESIHDVRDMCFVPPPPPPSTRPPSRHRKHRKHLSGSGQRARLQLTELGISARALSPWRPSDLQFSSAASPPPFSPWPGGRAGRHQLSPVAQRAAPA